MASPSKRNKVVGDWCEIQRETVSDYYGERHTDVIIEMADMLDAKLNHRYQGGSRRVRCEGDARPLPRAKTFVGETAWSYAESYAHDIEWKIRDTYREDTLRVGFRPPT